MQTHKDEILKKINAHLIHHLNFSETHEVATIPFQKLLSPKRFDVLAKYIYAHHYKNNFDLTWATEVYKEHLRCLTRGNFVEGDLSSKESFEKYLSSFNFILNDFEKDGFDKSKSLIPIGNNSIIIDGGHRSAACLTYQTNPTVVRFNHLERGYSAEDLKALGLSEIYLDAMATEYARLSDHCYLVFLFPVANGKKEEVSNILSSYGAVVYEKELQIYNNGPINLTAQLYKAEHWLGSRKDGWPGASSHAESKFVKGQPLTTFLFECDDINKVKEAKFKIRELFEYGNASVHINDTKEETVRLAEQIYNKNSLHLINNGDLSKQELIFTLHETFKKNIAQSSFNKETLSADGSTVLALYGLREVNDFDYLDYDDQNKDFSNELIHQHNQELKYYSQSLGNLVFNPSHFLYYDGIKYCSLDTIVQMKKTRSELKDFEDINLANTLIQTAPIQTWTPLKGLVNKKKAKFKIKPFIKKHIPQKMLPLAKKTYSVIKKLKRSLIDFIQAIPDYLKFGDVSLQYLGFKLFYSAGTSLIDRVRTEKIYEPSVTTAIIRELQSFKEPAVLDIGCNIGLIALNILKYSDAKIYAFEPGKHQFDLLQKTVTANALTDKIKIYNTALSNYTGNATFSVHSTRHASGDGLKDTQRAGKTKKITVPVKKLDDWWAEENKPRIDFIKIDTEGAELLVLNGATTLLHTARPIILLEICQLNLRVYDYTAIDIVSFLHSHNYVLKTLAGSVIDKENIQSYMGTFEEFLAYPNSSGLSK